MYLTKPEKFKTLYVDPGENTGWCLANGPKLLAGGQERLWPFADDVHRALASGGSEGPLGCQAEAEFFSRKGIGPKQLEPPIGRIVIEDFRIYPWKVNELKWDPVRTARLIGAITLLARIYDLEFHIQPAAIKERAEAGGAEEYFYRPIHENRHVNDAIRHFTYFSQLGPAGDPRVAERVSEAENA